MWKVLRGEDGWCCDAAKRGLHPNHYTLAGTVCAVEQGAWHCPNF